MTWSRIPELKSPSKTQPNSGSDTPTREFALQSMRYPRGVGVERVRHKGMNVLDEGNVVLIFPILHCCDAEIDNITGGLGTVQLRVGGGMEDADFYPKMTTFGSVCHSSKQMTSRTVHGRGILCSTTNILFVVRLALYSIQIYFISQKKRLLRPSPPGLNISNECTMKYDRNTITCNNNIQN